MPVIEPLRVPGGPKMAVGCWTLGCLPDRETQHLCLDSLTLTLLGGRIWLLWPNVGLDPRIRDGGNYLVSESFLQILYVLEGGPETKLRLNFLDNDRVGVDSEHTVGLPSSHLKRC